MLLSPYKQFFGIRKPIDPLRDLRAAIGEILLFKKPKKGVSSPMSEYRAKWGIVVFRAFNGTGVLQAYLIETKSYGHRFKFELTVTDNNHTPSADVTG
jgi:hypothetical protein